MLYQFYVFPEVIPRFLVESRKYAIPMQYLLSYLYVKFCVSFALFAVFAVRCYCFFSHIKRKETDQNEMQSSQMINLFFCISCSDSVIREASHNQESSQIDYIYNIILLKLVFAICIVD